MTAPPPLWSPQQAKALDDVAAWLKDDSRPIYRLFGYAGTGKTTLAKHLASGCNRPIFAAFTGKAASVLRDAGCPGARTLHRLLYNVTNRDRAKLHELEGQLSLLDATHRDFAELKAEVDLERDKVRRPWFYVNEQSDLRAADLLVVDEVSMVDKKIGQDILSFGKKVLVLGDPAQLPPVRGGGFFTDAKPDTLLTEIHRQAKDNPILRWATMARNGEVIPYENLGNGTAIKVRRERISDEWLAKAAGQILCGKNETRHDLNARVRKQLGFLSQWPMRHDKLVMLMNNYKTGMLNGTIGTAYSKAQYDEDDHSLWFDVTYEGETFHRMTVDPAPFEGKEPQDRKHMHMDYGYALTVHKAQGSQWPKVTVWDDGFAKREPENRKRWMYTAITRAQGELVIVTS